MNVIKRILKDGAKDDGFVRSLADSYSKISQMPGFGKFKNGLPPSLSHIESGTLGLRKMLKLNSEVFGFILASPVVKAFGVEGKNKNIKLRKLFSLAEFRQFTIFCFIYSNVFDIKQLPPKFCLPCLEASILTNHYGKDVIPVDRDVLADVYPPLGTEAFFQVAHPALLSLLMCGKYIVKDLEQWPNLPPDQQEKVAESAFALASLVASQDMLDSFCAREPDLAPLLGTLAPDLEQLTAPENITKKHVEIPWRQAVDELARAAKAARHEDPAIALANMEAAFEQVRLSAAAEIERLAEENAAKSKTIEAFLDTLRKIAKTSPWLAARLSDLECEWIGWLDGNLSAEFVEKTVVHLPTLVSTTLQELITITNSLEKASADRAALSATEKPASPEGRIALIESIRNADIGISDLSIKEIQVEAKLEGLLTPPTLPADAIAEASDTGSLQLPVSTASPLHQVEIAAVSTASSTGEAIIPSPPPSETTTEGHLGETEPRTQTGAIPFVYAGVIEQPFKTLALAIVDGKTPLDLPVAWASLSCAALAEGQHAAAYHAANVANLLGYANSGHLLLKVLAIGSASSKMNLFGKDFLSACEDAYLAGARQFHGDVEANGLLTLAACLIPSLLLHETSSITTLLSEVTLPTKATALNELLMELKNFMNRRIRVDLDIIAEIKRVDQIDAELFAARERLSFLLEDRHFMGMTYAPAKSVLRHWLQSHGIIGSPLTTAISGNYHVKDLEGFAQQMRDKSFVESNLDRTDRALRPGVKTKIELGARRDIILFARNVGEATLAFLDADQAMKVSTPPFHIKQVMESRLVLQNISAAAEKELTGITNGDTPFTTKVAAQACSEAIRRLPSVFTDDPERRYSINTVFHWKAPALDISYSTDARDIPDLLAEAVNSAGGYWRKKESTAAAKKV